MYDKAGLKEKNVSNDVCYVALVLKKIDLKVKAAPNFLPSLHSVSDSSSPESIASTAVGEQEIFEAGAQRETEVDSTLPA